MRLDQLPAATREKIGAGKDRVAFPWAPPAALAVGRQHLSDRMR